MWTFFIKQSRFTFLVLLLVILSGLFATWGIPKEASPEVKIPYASVFTFYPGASPQDIEDLVTTPIEEKIANLDNLVTYTSISNEGSSIIFVEFEANSEIKEQISNLQDAVNQAVPNLPDDAETPLVSEQNFSNFPILTFSLSGDLSYQDLVQIAKELEQEFESIPGVSRVDLTGVQDPSVFIDLDLLALSSQQISLYEILSAFGKLEATAPIGSIEAQELSFGLRFDTPWTFSDLQNLSIRNILDSETTLSEVSDISVSYPDETSKSLLSLDGGEPQFSITISVYNKTGTDILDLVDTLSERIDELQENGTLDGVIIHKTMDNAQDTRDQLGDLTRDGINTVVLILVLLFFALGFKEAVMASLSIPLTFLITFVGLYAIGSSINFLSLFSLILSFGILVDTGIVITELMHTKLGQGKSMKEIAIESVEEYKWPIISGTLATVAVFFPMLLMTGIIGQFVKHIPITVSITLIASLFVGLALLPFLGTFLLKKKKQKTTLIERFLNWSAERYSRFLSRLLKRKIFQVFLLIFMSVLFLASLSLPITGTLEVSMFPPTDYRSFYIEVQVPKGSFLEATEAVVQDISDILREEEDIESFLANLGSSANIAEGLGAFGVSSPHLANFSVNLKEDRTKTSLEIIDELRSLFAEIPNAEISVQGVSEGPPSASPIEFKIIGPDLDVLNELSDQALADLESMPGVVNVKSSLEESSPTFSLYVNRDVSNQYGVDPSTLLLVTRILVSGLEITDVNINGQELPVILRGGFSENDIDEILKLPIVTQSGVFPLSTFVELSIKPAPVNIQHSDGDRIVTITADLESGANASESLTEFQELYQPDLGSDYRIEYGGESDEIVESFKSLGQAMFLGLFLLLIILVLQFNSFRQTLLILLTIPLALIGVFPGLYILGFPFSFPAFVGVVALGGVVVNNAILLMDCANTHIQNGVHPREAILESARRRFQPILLTTVTTVIGTLPLALTDPTWGPLGFTIICGLTFSTVLTLVIVPAAYSLLLIKKGES